MTSIILILHIKANKDHDSETKNVKLSLYSNFSFEIHFLHQCRFCTIKTTVKLGNRERFDKEQIGIKELFMDYQPFHTINLLLDN